MEKAKAFGKNLLLRVTGAIESSEEDEGRNHRKTKASYCEVVTRSPGGRPNGNDNGQVSVKTMINNSVQSGNSSGNLSGKTKFTQKLFFAEDIAKLVELARNQLRKDVAAKLGCIEAETKEKMRQEKLYARELVQHFQRSPELEPRYWQCNRSGHLSSSCPRGEWCFISNSPGHKRAECPAKKRATVAEKGKGLNVEPNGREQRRLRTGGPLRIGEQTEVFVERGQRRGNQNADLEYRRPPSKKEEEGTTLRRPETGKTTMLDLKKKQMNHEL